MIEKNDWRLQNQEAFLLKKGMVKQYDIFCSASDHEHCEFCTEKFIQGTHYQRPVYSTLNFYHWVCDICYEDFKEMFQWKEIGVNESVIQSYAIDINGKKTTLQLNLSDSNGNGYAYHFKQVFHYGFTVDPPKKKITTISRMSTSKGIQAHLSFTCDQYKEAWTGQFTEDELNDFTNKKIRSAYHFIFYNDGKPMISVFSNHCNIELL